MFDHDRKPKKLRDLLRRLGGAEGAEKQQDMEEHPLYQEGFDDGYAEAAREYQATLRHVIALTRT